MAADRRLSMPEGVAYQYVRQKDLMAILIHGLRVSIDTDVPGILLFLDPHEAKREAKAAFGDDHALVEVHLGGLPKNALAPDLAFRCGVASWLAAKHTWSTVDLGPERLSRVPPHQT
jgi:hypothetical protein